MAFSQRWAGRFFGTNVGNLYVKFEGTEETLRGVLRFNEERIGLSQFQVTGKFDGGLTLQGVVLQGSKLEGDQLRVTATVNSRGEFEGDWETNGGLGGTLILSPHERSESSDVDEPIPAQMHTARHRLGAVQISREEIERLAQDVQRKMKMGRTIITVRADTERSVFLEDFQKLALESDRAEVVKIFARGPAAGGIDNVVSIELGPESNEILTQGADQAWVLGRLEELKRSLAKHERNYATRFRRWGFGFNQALILAAIVYLPSLSSLLDRVLFFVGILAIVGTFNLIHRKHLPHAAIQFTTGRPIWWNSVSTVVWSWLTAVTATLVATLLAAYFEGWLAKFFE